MSHQFHSTVLREYDIRGIIGETLGVGRCARDRAGFATLLREAGGSKVAVGYDGRVSSPMLEHALVEGLNASGCDVVRVGMGPTPMLYYAEASMRRCGWRHPDNRQPQSRQLQWLQDGLSGPPVLRRRTSWSSARWRRQATGWTGTARSKRARSWTNMSIGCSQGCAGIDPARLAGLRVGWDAGNGAAGPALEALAARLPGEHHLLFTEVDGNFPNHHPDPTVEENLADLKRARRGEEPRFRHRLRRRWRPDRRDRRRRAG